MKMKILFLLLVTFCITLTFASPSGRIVGGESVDISSYGYQVSLRKKSFPKMDFVHSCGGTIYKDNIIITAAHCVSFTLTKELKVMAGTSWRNGTRGVLVPVQEIISHEHYNSSTVNNDIAILILALPLPLNGITMRSIDLINKEPKQGLVATVSGWGLLKADGKMPNQLQAVKVPIIGREECNKDYKGIITEAMLCAGYRGKGGKDSCTNDSGGPLVIGNRLAGVVSWGSGCASPNYPGVYADVWYFRDWILKNVAKYE